MPDRAKQRERERGEREREGLIESDYNWVIRL
jgi:hypothetical protein